MDRLARWRGNAWLRDAERPRRVARRALDKESIDAWCAGAGTPRILLNNAGGAMGRDTWTAARRGPARHGGGQRHRAVRVTRALLPEMLAARAGHIVTRLLRRRAASTRAARVRRHQAFGAGDLRDLRLELSGTDIRVTEIDPGLAETEFSIVRLGDVEKAKAVYRGFSRSPPRTWPTPSSGWPRGPRT